MMKKTYKLACILLALLLALTACGTAPSSSQPAASPSTANSTGTSQGGILKIAVSDDWSTFDPFFQISLANRVYNPMLFETLIRLGNGKYEPGLATEWSFNDDYTQITLKLRENVKFQDGSDFTAEDVVWNIERAKNTEAGYHITEYFSNCVEAQATDPHTVVITWASSDFKIEDALSRLYLICPETADDVATHPVGTGPFALEEWSPSDHATFVKNEYYWDEGKPYLDGVELSIITDAQSRAINLVSGNVDIVDNISTQDIGMILENDNLSIKENVPPEYKNFSMNITRAPFDNQLVRQAIAHAVDREAVRDMVYDGEGDIR